MPEIQIPKDIKVQSQNYQYILRMCNTNVDGRQKAMYALTAIKGIGRRMSHKICNTCNINLDTRAGELTNDDVNKIVNVMASPLQFRVPVWMLNRRKDFKDGKSCHNSTNLLDGALRNDIERMKKCRNHRGFRHLWGLKVRGQHTKTTGRGRWLMQMQAQKKGGKK